MRPLNFISSEANVARKNAMTNVLLSMQPGSIMLYEELTEKVGFDVREFSSLLSSVKTKITKEYQIVFGTLRGEGIIRLTSKGILLHAESKEASLRKGSQRAIQAIICINRNELIPEDQTKFDLMVERVGFVYAVMKDDTAAHRLAPFVHYPKNGPDIGADLRAIFGSQRRKLHVVPKTAA